MSQHKPARRLLSSYLLDTTLAPSERYGGIGQFVGETSFRIYQIASFSNPVHRQETVQIDTLFGVITSDTTRSISEFVNLTLTFAETDFTLYRGQPRVWRLRPKLARVRHRSAVSKKDLETALMKDFKNQSLGLLDITPPTEWDWLAVAQHHGLATRLLDWTTNPLVALWFAVREPPSAKKSTKKLRPGIVWVFNPDKEDYADPDGDIGPYSVKENDCVSPQTCDTKNCGSGRMVYRSPL